MKEININIEGYNVNGICVGCLNYNRKMYYVDQVKDCFKLLAEIDVPDGLTIQVCWECLAAVRKVVGFQEQILKSYDILIQYSRKFTFLNSPKDLSQYAATRLSACHVSNSNMVLMTDDVVKEEELGEIDDLKLEPDNVDVEKTILEYNVDIKDEFVYNEKIQLPVPDLDDGIDVIKDGIGVNNDGIHINNDSIGINNDGIDVNNDVDDTGQMTSDDDVVLSKIKKKKGKRADKKIKLEKKKKFKNDQPFREIHLTEEEMWKLRKQDLADEAFVKLKYKCQDCILSFQSKKLMEQHFKSKHVKTSTKTAQCPTCRSFFVNNVHLARHTARHFRGFACVHCDHRSSCRQVAAAHAESHPLQPMLCSSCGESFSTKSKLKYHKITCQQEKPQCVCCGIVFANKLTLKYHLKVLPVNKDKPKENVTINCKGCNKVFYSKKSYRSHVVIHDGLQYHCQVCNKPFQWKRNLARHMRNHRDRDNGSLHECKQCSKRFSSRDCYNNHMRFSKRHVAEDKLSHECSFCGKKFATRWCLVDHADWEHLERVKYRCGVCHKAFKTAKIMVAHMNNIHNGGNKKEPDGSHLCDICGKSYKTEKRLKGHVWSMHTRRSTEKSYKCNQCPATFIWQTSIYKHMKMMHDRRGITGPAKQTRQQTKKEEPYDNHDPTNRIPYYQHGLPTNLQSDMQNVGVMVEVPGSVPGPMGL